MTVPEVAPEQVLAYDRIAQNRRKTWLLVAVAIAALAPFVWGISYGVASFVAGRVAPSGRATRAMAARQEALLRRELAAGGERTEWVVDLEERIAEQRAQADKQESEYDALRLKLLPVAGLGLLAALGILFWGIASSPTSKLLVQAGAQPAGHAEAEAQRLLENLCIGAGLPTPKLYVIESSAPNAFAAGMHPDCAVIAITRGALQLLDRRELEGVLAHELSHIGNHDIRLNTIVASIALFLRLPYLMIRKEIRDGAARGGRDGWGGLWRLAVSPLGLYVFFIAPIVATLIRAAVSRQREYLADADAALLTRYPDGLMRALAKVGGAGSGLAGSNPAFSHFYFSNPVDGGGSWFSGKLFSTHPPLADRVERLAGMQGASGLAGLETAVEEGRKFIQTRPVVELDQSLGLAANDELAALNQGNVMGRVYRLLSPSPVPVYDMPNLKSCRVATVLPGSFIVAFDDPSPMRQVNTADQTFGYIDRKVKLKAVDNMIPAEVYDPRLRAAAEARFASIQAAAPPKSAAASLTRQQLAIALGFGVVVFAGMMLVLLQLGSR